MNVKRESETGRMIGFLASWGMKGRRLSFEHQSRGEQLRNENRSKEEKKASLLFHFPPGSISIPYTPSHVSWQISIQEYDI